MNINEIEAEDFLHQGHKLENVRVVEEDFNPLDRSQTFEKARVVFRCDVCKEQWLIEYLVHP